jgi:hypothetical protein
MMHEWLVLTVLTSTGTSFDIIMFLLC